MSGITKKDAKKLAQWMELRPDREADHELTLLLQHCWPLRVSQSN